MSHAVTHANAARATRVVTSRPASRASRRARVGVKSCATSSDDVALGRRDAVLAAIALGALTRADDARDERLSRRAAPDEVAGRPLAIDGFNLLTTVESALGGGTY